ncbi:hypothetical protein IJV79_04865 [bacterium]|nr:hypothetical protein [bacterium]
MKKGIIIFSGKQYSGKDTVGKIFLEQLKNFKRCAMGDIIKIQYGKEHNLTLNEVEKNKAIYRQDLINLGNWGRSQSPDYWIKRIISEPGNLIVTDVRVQHEYETFKNAGAIAIRVEATPETRSKRGPLIGSDDVTEIGLDHIKNWDYVINNDGSYEDLVKNSLKIIKEIEEKYVFETGL